MFNPFVDKEKCVYYCKECNKIYKSCYELENITMCPVCWSEDVKILNETEIPAFIRGKRLKRLNQISKDSE